MANDQHETAIYVVIQTGGSTHEHYLHSFAEKRAATEYMSKATRASYRCIGPFEILLAAEANLARVAARTVEWLKSEGYQNDEHTRDLERAVFDLKKDLRLN